MSPPREQDNNRCPRGRAYWFTVEWLPKYAPEINDIKVVWHDLKGHYLAHQTFTDAEAFDRASNLLELRAKLRSVGQTENLCLACCSSPSARYERHSILITANQLFGEWNRVFHRLRHDLRLSIVSSTSHHHRDEVESYRRRTAIE